MWLPLDPVGSESLYPPLGKGGRGDLKINQNNTNCPHESHVPSPLMELVVSAFKTRNLWPPPWTGAWEGWRPLCPGTRIPRSSPNWRTGGTRPGSMGCKFYLTWDWLLRERELAGVPDMLAAVARHRSRCLAASRPGPRPGGAPALSQPASPGRRQLRDPQLSGSCGWRPPWDSPGWWWRDPSA